MSNDIAVLTHRTRIQRHNVSVEQQPVTSKLTKIYFHSFKQGYSAPLRPVQRFPVPSTPLLVN